jgi:hypothetical protein
LSDDVAAHVARTANDQNGIHVEWPDPARTLSYRDPASSDFYR